MHEVVYHCGYWYGHHYNLDFPCLRHNPLRRVPPIRPQDLLHKPADMRPEITDDLARAEEWLCLQMDRFIGLAGTDRDAIIADRQRLRRELSTGCDITWQHHWSDGMTIWLAVVADAVDRQPETRRRPSPVPLPPTA